MIDMFIQMLPGILVTMALFFVTLLLSLPLGLFIIIISKKVGIVGKKIIEVYVLLMRGTPLILQIFFFYYGAPFVPFIGKYLIFGRFETAALAFVLNYAAYFSEIFRGGLLAIPKGQFEAAKVLGMTARQTIIKIIIPQVFRVTLPAISNEVIILIKDTALVAVVGVADLLYITKTIVNRESSTTPFIIAAVCYLLISYVATIIMQKLEKKFAC